VEVQNGKHYTPDMLDHSMGLNYSYLLSYEEMARLASRRERHQHQAHVLASLFGHQHTAHNLTLWLRERMCVMLKETIQRGELDAKSYPDPLIDFEQKRSEDDPAANTPAGSVKNISPWVEKYIESFSVGRCREALEFSDTSQWVKTAEHILYQAQPKKQKERTGPLKGYPIHTSTVWAVAKANVAKAKAEADAAFERKANAAAHLEEYPQSLAAKSILSCERTADAEMVYERVCRSTILDLMNASLCECARTGDQLELQFNAIPTISRFLAAALPRMRAHAAIELAKAKADAAASVTRHFQGWRQRTIRKKRLATMRSLGRRFTTPARLLVNALTRNTSCTVPQFFQNIEPVEPSAPPPPSGRSDDECCVICLEGSRDYAFLPCGHKCVCSGKCKEIEYCPICRTKVESKAHIFIV